MKKKGCKILFALCTVLLCGALLSLAGHAAEKIDVNTVDITVATPKAGAMPGEATIPEDMSTQVIKTEWEGDFNSDGSFKSGYGYTVYVTVSIKDRSAKRLTDELTTLRLYVNNIAARLEHWDEYEGKISYLFQEVPDASSDLEQFQAGTMVVTGASPYVYELPDSSSKKIGTVRDGATVKVLSAYVDGKETSSYHMIEWNGTVGYIMCINSKGEKWTYSATPSNTTVEVTQTPPARGSVAIAEVNFTCNLGDIPSFRESKIVGTLKPGTKFLILATDILDGDPTYNYCAVAYGGKVCYLSYHNMESQFSNFQVLGIQALMGVNKTFFPTAEVSRAVELTAVGNLIFDNDDLLDLYRELRPYQTPVLQSGVGDSVSATRADGGYAGSTTVITDIKYSTDNPEPYSYVTAKVTVQANEGYYFTKNVKAKEDVMERSTGGYSNRNEVAYVSSDTVIVTVTAWVGANGLEQPVTEEMEEYWEEIQETTANSQAAVATGTLRDPLGIGYIWKYPTMCGSEVGKSRIKNQIVAGSVTFAQLDKTVKIFDLHAERLFADGTVVGQWYLVGAANRVGFIPAAFLTDVKETGNWDDSPATVRTTDFTFAGGTGTQEDPYLIETAEQLNSVRYGLNKHYKLIADIDLSNWGNWQPIGGTPAYGGYSNSSASDADKGFGVFTGTFNGNGRVISGMTIVDHREDIYMSEQYTQGVLDRQYGLFGQVNGYSVGGKRTKVVYDLGIINYTIDLEYTGLTNWVSLHVAPFASRFENAMLYNCYSAGGKINVHVDADTSETVEVAACGLVTDLSMATVKNCYNTSDITITTNNVRQNQYDDENGFDLSANGCGVAWELVGSIVENTFNTGNITVPLSTFWSYSAASGIADGAAPPVEALGLMGWGEEHEYASVIRNCYNTGSLYGNSAVGILRYTIVDCYIINCYNVGALTTGTYQEEYQQSQNISADITVSYSAIWKGNYIRNVGVNSVSGDVWQNSGSLGRKVLKANPEDSLKIPTLQTVTTQASIVGSFKDVLANSWYAESVKWAVEQSITSGTSDTTFSPDQTCSRAAILTFLYRAVGSPEITIANPYTDVSRSDWYYTPAVWAYESGLYSDTTFAGNTPCTRAEAVTYLWKNGGKGEVLGATEFDDVSESVDYYLAVRWASVFNITSGTSDHTFSPDQTCTRSQIVTFLKRAMAL